MKDKRDILHSNKVFGWLAVAIGAILLIPLIAAQFSDDVNWSLSDFVIMGALMFLVATLFVLAARKFKRNRVVIGVILGILFLYVWAELAVGIFTNLGS